MHSSLDADLRKARRRTPGGARRLAVPCRLRALATLVAAGLVVAALAVTTAPASAAPLEPTMTMARLGELLAASPTGTLDGSFKTAVKGATIATIPCTVHGIVPQAATDNGDLIMIKASGPVIDEAGGIAAGMSGSPLYVADGGSDLLVGAVSYGEYFTDNGLGLATPIEHMMELETSLADVLSLRVAKTIRLDEPVETGSVTVRSVAVAPTTRAARLAGGGDTVVMRALSSLMVGGMPTDSAAYRALRSDMATKGIEIRGGLDAGAAGSAPAFETPLVPGSSVGMLHMRGDYWYGGVGTTTYTTAAGAGALVAFGHPMEYEGRLSAYMTNADVIGLWDNSFEPHKVVAPGKVRGSITVDSGAGIAGVIGDTPAEVPFTCTATNTATGKTVTHTTRVTQFAADQSKYPYTDLNAMSFYPALYQATGDRQYNGHLEYTLKIAVSDGVNNYTITRGNVWEDSYGWDAAFLAVCDLYSLFMTLTDDPDGTIGMHVKSIAMDAVLSPRLERFRVADVAVPGGLKTGPNTVEVTLYEYGSTAPKVVEMPLTLPEGMSTKGTLHAKAPYTNVQSEGDGWYSIWSYYSGSSSEPPQTLGQVVDELNSALPNKMLLVAYSPPDDDYVDDWGDGEPWGDKAVVSTLDMDKYVTGSVEKQQAHVSLDLNGGRHVSGQKLTLRGTVSVYEKLDGETVKIYQREAGASADRLLKEVPITYVGDDEEEGENEFVAVLPKGVRHNGTLTAAWEGDEEDYLCSRGSVPVKVRAKVGLAARKAGDRRVRLVATVRPGDAGGRVAFKRKVKGGGYRTIRKVAVRSSGRATCVFAAKQGSNQVVAVFLGSALNAAATSPSKTVRIE